MSSIRWILLAMLISAMVIGARAQDDEEPEVDAEEQEDEEYIPEEKDQGLTGIVGRAMFEGQEFDVVPKFHAGEKVTTYVTFTNAAENPQFDIFFVAAALNHVSDPTYFFQNFSGTRHARIVAGGETATFKYTFTPDEMLDPRDYNLVVRSFFRNDNNQTFIAVAFNETVTIMDPLGTDPQTILTFATIFAIIGAVAYFFMSTRKTTHKPAARSQKVETGTSGDGFDPDYVSNEHMKYQEAINRKSSQSPKRK